MWKKLRLQTFLHVVVQCPPGINVGPCSGRSHRQGEFGGLGTIEEARAVALQSRFRNGFLLLSLIETWTWDVLIICGVTTWLHRCAVLGMQENTVPHKNSCKLYNSIFIVTKARRERGDFYISKSSSLLFSLPFPLCD